MPPNRSPWAAPGGIPEGLHPPWKRIIGVSLLVLIPLLIWVLGGFDFERGKPKPEPTARLHSSGRSVVDGMKKSWQGIPQHVEEPPPVVTPAVTNHVAPDTSQMDKLLDEMTRQNKLLIEQNKALEEKLRAQPQPTPKAEDPEVKQRREEAKRRAEERRKEDEHARQTLVFWEAKNDEKKDGRKGIQRAESPYMLQAGATKINCILENGMNSDIPGPIVARVLSPVYDSIEGQHLMIPVQSVLSGQQRGNPIFGESRIPLAISRIGFPNGSHLKFGKDVPGLDGIGQAGLTGDVDNHWGRMLASIVITGVLRGGTQSMGGFAGGVGERIGSSVVQEGSSEGQQRTRRFLNSNPTITVEPSTPCLIILEEDFILPGPYHEG